MIVEIRGMRTGLAAASLLLAALWSIAGCGGSGSSGFDVIPANQEAAAISQAIDEQRCVDFEQRTFCASGVVAEAGHFAGALVNIESPEGPLVCDPHVSGTACTASLNVTAEGFTIVNSTVAAVSESERGPWRLVPLSVSEDIDGSDTVLITVQPNGGGTKPLIAAVLVYRGVVAPDDIPPMADRLADFGVDLVYVSSRLEIVVPR